jgi:hypothetical protein
MLVTLLACSGAQRKKPAGMTSAALRHREVRIGSFTDVS